MHRLYDIRSLFKPNCSEILQKKLFKSHIPRPLESNYYCLGLIVLVQSHWMILSTNYLLFAEIFEGYDYFGLNFLNTLSLWANFFTLDQVSLAHQLVQ